MIRNSRNLLLVLAAAVALTACGPAKDSTVDAAKSAAAAPTADALLALDQQATEAYVKGDGKFFENFLSDKMAMQQGGSRLSKADVVKMISGVNCEVKAGWTLTKPQLLEIDDDTYVLGYESDIQGSCTVDGKTKKIPSPVRAATVWVRNGDKWLAAFHGENLIVDPTAPPSTDKEAAPEEDAKAPADTSTAAIPAPAKPAADPITEALMTAENSAWDAWMAKDAKKIEDLTAKDIAFVDIFGVYSANKAAAIKAWTGSACEISSFSLTNGVGTTVSPKVAILTLTGTVNGTCGDKDISGLKIYGNTVYVKDGSAWKWAFGFNSPT
jgi:ketosteroid isomerase-like protein